MDYQWQYTCSRKFTSDWISNVASNKSSSKNTFSGDDWDLAIACPKLSRVKRPLEVTAAKQWSFNPCVPPKIWSHSMRSLAKSNFTCSTNNQLLSTNIIYSSNLMWSKFKSITAICKHWIHCAILAFRLSTCAVCTSSAVTCSTPNCFRVSSKAELRISLEEWSKMSWAHKS